MATITLEGMRQHQLVILRRLRHTPLTEFELASQVAEHSGYTDEEASGRMQGWLEQLQAMGLIWAGALTNATGQQLLAAALTSKGRDVVH